jgi:hypothetical protein
VTAQAQETDLTARLSAWTVAQGITAADSPAALADRVIASLGPAYVAGHLAGGGTGYLRATAAMYASPDLLSDGQWATEEHYHGHGAKPPKRRRNGNG